MNDLSSKIIGTLLTLLLGLVAYETHRLLSEIRVVIRRQRLSEQVLREFIRSMFTLLSGLYPEQAKVITTEIQKFYLRNTAFFMDAEKAEISDS